MKKTYYEFLGVSPQASLKEIKTVVQRLAQQCHPDKYPGDAQMMARFKQVQVIYKVLANPQKRAAYDASLAKEGRVQSSQKGGAAQQSKGVQSANDVKQASERVSPAVATKPVSASEEEDNVQASRVVSTDEKVVYRAHVHWVGYVQALLIMGVAAYFLFVDPQLLMTYLDKVEFLQGKQVYVKLGLQGVLVIGVWILLSTLVAQLTTTLMITPTRTVAKVGLIVKEEVEIEHARFEHIEINQSLLGKILGFGMVKMRGTKGRGVGGLKIKVDDVAAPKQFEKQLMRTMKSQTYKKGE